MNDLKFAFRQMLKNPGFTVVAVLTLALGIGANTAMFSIISGVLLKPLAYRDSEQIVTLLHGGQRPVAPADFLDWRTQSQSFEKMAAAELWGGILTGGDRPEDIPGIRFGDGMFQLLGVQPLLGRTFQADDFEPGKGHVVVLGHALWQRRFGGDPGVVGRSLTINGESYTVLGVMPSQFRFAPFWASKAEMAAPLDLAQRAASRGGSSLRVFARLKPGVSLERAQTEMNTICHRLELAYPDTNTGRTVQVDSLLEQVVGNLRRGLLILAGAVGFVLLIACANVANLLLIRASAREKEMAIRTALGASRWRTIRQLLIESLVLAAIAGAVGLAVGYGSVFAMKGWLSQMPRGAEIVADSSVLWFTLGVALLTGLVFGLAPALQSIRSGIHASLKDSGRGTTGGRSGRHLRSALVVVEVALALVMLSGAGLMLRSYGRLSGIDPGFNPKNVLAIQVSLRGQREMVGERREAFYHQLFETVDALPGVVSASAINHLPLDGDLWNLDLFVEGRPLPEPGKGITPAFRVCRPAYFGTMNIPVLRGRDFTAQDREGDPLVAIINEHLASRQWPGADPVGQRITLDDPGSNPEWRTIVGVVKDAKQRSWTDPAGDEIYLPFSQSPFQSDAAGHFSSMSLVIRSATDPSSLAKNVQDAATSLNHQAVVSAGTTMEQVVANTLSEPRFNLVLIGLFAGLALVLGAVGIYGVMAYSVSQRTQEIGIRMALGAHRSDVTNLVLRQGMRLAGMGIGIGLLGSFAVSQLLQSQLFEINATDPATLSGVSLMLGMVAALACWIPARRAAKVDPMVALRSE
jgi:predicted permease